VTADVWIALGQPRRLADVVNSAVQQYSRAVSVAHLTHGVQREVQSNVFLHMEVGEQHVERADGDVVRCLVHEVADHGDAHRTVVPTAANRRQQLTNEIRSAST